ncbi:MAG: Peptidase [Bacteroidota bacterium]|nr:Peptidase [Bacteroidota bacterium]
MKQVLIFLLISVIVITCKSPQRQKRNAFAERTGNSPAVVTKTVAVKPCNDPKSHSFLDIDVDGLYVREKEFSRKDNVQKIFKTNKLDKNQYAQFLEDSKEYYDFTTVKTRQKYFTITKETDSSSQLQYLVFKISDYEYVIANCTDTSMVTQMTADENVGRRRRNKHAQKAVYYHPIQIAYYEKNIDTIQIKFAAVIQRSVSKTFRENNLDSKLIEKLSGSLSNKFNLNSLHSGDTLQFIYNQLSVNGQFLDYGHVQAICIKTKKKQYYALDYFLKDDSSYQYVDNGGKYLKSAFLKSPLQKGGNIVSRYNLHRFHPVLQVEKAHLGTDFAAPKGSPIIATASGVIEAAQFTQNNGNYVKIRHDRIYETQYLHMCRFAKGIRNGVRVQKGQVIGYVGMTGLATGPHVCYRFWKHGAQVDPLKEKLNTFKQIPNTYLGSYLKYFASIRKTLDAITLR